MTYNINLTKTNHKLNKEFTGKFLAKSKAIKSTLLKQIKAKVTNKNHQVHYLLPIYAIVSFQNIILNEHSAI